MTNGNRVEHLDLSENDIGPINFGLMQKVFVINTNIETLNLADCKIDGEQTKILCNQLKRSNSKLKYFYIRNCNIGDEGAKAIAALIDNNKSLQHLEIFNCGITEKGGNLIGGALKTNFCIEKLSIGDNKLDRKDVEQIQQSVIFNT
jgi:Ran GTPase-activating protein (RanGAP) involved in mRNA processing and transport